MKFEIKQKELIKALSIVNRAVSKSTNIQIHELIYLSTENDRLSSNSFHSQISITTVADGNIIKDRVMAVKADLITNITRTLTDELRKIELDNGKINNSCKRSKFNLVAFEYFDTEEIK